MNSFQYKLDENINNLNYYFNEMKIVDSILSQIETLVSNEKIISCESLLPDIVIPSNMSGINKPKYAVFVESELIDKLKKLLRKIAHFIFGAVTNSIDYMQEELDYLEQIRKKLAFYKRELGSNESRFDKVKILKKMLPVFDQKETTEKTSAIRNIITQFELILQKNTISKSDFDWKKVKDDLSVLGYIFDKEKVTITLDASKVKPVEKDVVEDMGWNFNKIEDQVIDLLHIFESRKVFDHLVKKLNDIKNKSKSVESKISSIKDDDESKNVKEEVTELKEEFTIIESMKKIIFKYLHTLSHQISILLKNLYKD